MQELHRKEEKEHNGDETTDQTTIKRDWLYRSTTENHEWAEQLGKSDANQTVAAGGKKERGKKRKKNTASHSAEEHSLETLSSFTNSSNSACVSAGAFH